MTRFRLYIEGIKFGLDRIAFNHVIVGSDKFC